MSNTEKLQINEEALKAFEEAQKQFKGFELIDIIPEDKIDMSKADLPEFTEEENANRVMQAMERLYGKEENMQVGSNKTVGKKRRKRK